MTTELKHKRWIGPALGGFLLLAVLAAATPSAMAADCVNHGGDTDGDGMCDDVDPDNDNDGAGDGCDPDPNSYDEVDFLLCKVHGGGKVAVLPGALTRLELVAE